MKPGKVSVFLAGDAMITRPWSDVSEPAFLSLVQQIREADVAIANLETVIHEFKGHAQANSGGVYMASPPEIAAELKWAGFDMLTHANNHAFDYGAKGVLETLQHAENAGLIIAGSGPDLQSARAPRYFQGNGSIVALVAMASDFVPYGKASPSRPDLPGRPGINPLTIGRARRIKIPLKAVDRLRAFGWRLRGFPEPSRNPLDLEIIVAWGRRADRADLNANLAAVSEAAANADIVIASIHAHRQGRWLRDFARQSIDRGAHIVFAHGPHRVLGIELYRDRPIFYSLGDFVFEAEYVSRLPAEAYERVGLAASAPLEDLKAANDRHMSGLSQERAAFEGVGASIVFAGRRLSQIRVFPIDLKFDCKHGNRGRPQLATPELARNIIRVIEARSRTFKTRIHYDSAENLGVVLA